MIISILVFSNSHANEVEYEDWAGLYFPKYKYEKNLIKKLPKQNLSFIEVCSKGWVDKRMESQQNNIVLVVVKHISICKHTQVTS